MSDDDDGNVLVFRNERNEPVVVPTAVALENDRSYRAYQLHMAGRSWDFIAHEEGFVDARAAKSEVTRYAAEARSLLGEYTRRDLLSNEIARLDALQAVIWPQAMKGHLPAVREATNIVMSRIKVLGLDQGVAEDGDGGKPTTVVIYGEEEYAASLQRAIDEG